MCFSIFSVLLLGGGCILSRKGRKRMTRLLFSLYGFAFFNKFLLLTPVYSIFMLENGLTDFQLSTMFIVSAIGTILGQVPVAYLTNHMGQRWAMIIGQFLKMFAILLWLIMPNYVGFFTGMFLWGVQAGFRSVAFEGLVYDSVSAAGMSKQYPRILGRKSTYESIGTALSACGSLLMFLGYDWVTWSSVLAILLSMVCLLVLPYRPATPTAPVSGLKLKKLMRAGLHVVRRTPCLMSVMLLTLLVVNVPFLDDFLSPIAVNIGIPTEYVGILSFFLLACATLGQRFAYKFNHLTDRFLYWLVAIVGICYLAFSVTYTSASLWMMGVAYMLFYGVYTLLYSRFQNMIPTANRSIVLSLYTTLTYLVYMGVCGVIGLGSLLGSWRYSIMILGFLELCVFAWAMLFVRRSCSSRGQCLS